MDWILPHFLQFLSVFPLVSTVIVVNKYLFIQSGEIPSSTTGLLEEVRVGNRGNARIACGLECNRIPECVGVDVYKTDSTICRLLSGFVSLKPSPNPSNRTFRYQKSNGTVIGRESLCNLPLTTGQIISGLCYQDEYLWMVIQRRLDGSVDFKRNWTEYDAGFGSLYSNFWIGNANIHALTSDGYTFLRIELMNHNGVWRYAEYGSFYIEDKSAKYKMHVSSYSGNAGDSFTYHNNMTFSTYDNDNDNSIMYNCAIIRLGGWWYNACHRANLNGEYGNANHSDGLNWHAWMGFNYSMTETRMMLRKP